ncbi:MAG: hypothetical protein WBE13_11515 [Candidatus Acidiferrum sp.]
MRGYVSKLKEDFGFIAANKKLYYFRLTDVKGQVQIGTKVEFRIINRKEAFEKRLMAGLEKDTNIGSFRKPKMPTEYRSNGKGQTVPQALDVKVVEQAAYAA